MAAKKVAKKAVTKSAKKSAKKAVKTVAKNAAEKTSPKSSKKKRKQLLMLLDGNAIIHRAFHGIPPLTMTDGTQVNAVYGFTSTLLNVLEKFQPTHVIASFDLPGKTFRNDMFSEYKANRSETPEDLVPQFDLTKEVVRAFTIPIIEQKNVEADDVIGTLARQAEAQGVDVVIVTGDRDTLQLVSKRISVFTMSRGISDMILYNREKVIEKIGVPPERVIDYKGLCGDSSDNIPGVKGVGDKTALTLLGAYGDLDGVYKNIDDTKGALNKNLHADKELAYLSRELGTIKTDVDGVTLDLDDADTQTISWSGARTAFQKFSFNSLTKRLGSRGIEEQDRDTPAKKVGERIDPAHVEKYIAGIDATEIISLAIDGDENSLHGIGVAHSGGAAYLPYNKKSMPTLKMFLQSTQVRKSFFDSKKALHLCAAHDIALAGIARDVQLMIYVARSGAKIDFDDLVFEITGRMAQKIEKKPQMMLDLRSDDDASECTMQRAVDTKALATYFSKEIDTIVATQKAPATVTHILDDLEMPLVRVLYDMERAGVLLDKKLFTKIAKETDAHIAKLEKAIYKDAGEEFNINSTKQLRIILFERLEISTADIKKTKTGFSTASSELDKIRDMHPIVARIEEYRELFKLKTTYIDVLPTLTDDGDRVHTTYNQAITPTGRLSSSDPNLQNIPIRTEVGRRLRDAFIAPTGKKLISADYSQIELRCVAHVAKDVMMTKAFAQHADIHTYTAAAVLGKKESNITKEERRSAKELNFGLIYGMGAFSFAKSADISVEKAQKFIDAYFEQFSGVKKYMDNTKKQGEEMGYVETLLGRRKNTPELASKNFQLRAAGERAAINMPIQGLAADIMKLAMIAVDAYLKEEFPAVDAQIILQVHDEIILEVTDAHVAQISKDLKEIMEGVYELTVPLIADVSSGQNWGEL